MYILISSLGLPSTFVSVLICCENGGCEQISAETVHADHIYSRSSRRIRTDSNPTSRHVTSSTGSLTVNFHKQRIPN